MTAAATEHTLTPRQRIAVAVGILPAGMLTGMDTFAVSIALPRMQGVLSATLTEISWILTAYLVASAIFTPLYGWLSRRVGRKRLFIAIIIGFSISAILIAQSDSLTEIIIFRFIQGFFGAGFNPLLMQVVLATFPREQQGTAFGWLTTGRMSGIIIGPILGGVMTEFFSWRYVFLTNVPLGLLAVLMIARYVPEGRDGRALKFDFFGFIFLSIAIGAFQLMLDQGQRHDWFDSPFIIILGAITLCTVYVFAVHVMTTRNAYLNPAVLKNRDFLIGLLLGFLLNFMVFGYAGLLPPILQQHMGYPVLTTGFVMMPRGFGTMASSLLAGALLLRYPPKPFVAIGVIMIAASTFLLSQFTPDVDAFSVMLVTFIQGSGFGFLAVSITTVTFQSMSTSMRSDGTSVLSLARRLGSSVGVSVLVGQLARSTQSARSTLTENISEYNERFQHFSLPDRWNMEQVQGVLSLDRVIDKQAEFIAYLHDFRLMTILMLLLLPLVFLLRGPQKPGSGGED